MKKYLGLFLILLFPLSTHALSKEDAINQYIVELGKVGVEEPDVKNKAEQEVDDLIEGMEASQYDIDVAYKALETRIKGLLKNDGRRDVAQKGLSEAEEKVSDFKALEAQNSLEVQPVNAGALPRVLPNPDFEQARVEAETAMNEVNRILIGPERPGQVPEGDLVKDFLPNLIRQLFRFAWVAVFIAFTVSGVMLVFAKDKEERVTQAKDMIYYSIMGFAVIALAFAIVKAITDIDFFAFI